MPLNPSRKAHGFACMRTLRDMHIPKFVKKFLAPAAKSWVGHCYIRDNKRTHNDNDNS